MMPYKSLHPCSAPGCPELVRDGRYCKQHASKVNKQYDQERGTSAQRGYGANWRRLRKMKLNQDPTCEDPFGLHKKHSEVVGANEVDHIIPLKNGGTNEMDNLSSLCKSCHSRKTAKEDGRWGLAELTKKLVEDTHDYQERMAKAEELTLQIASKVSQNEDL